VHWRYHLRHSAKGPSRRADNLSTVTACQENCLANCTDVRPCQRSPALAGGPISKSFAAVVDMNSPRGMRPSVHCINETGQPSVKRLTVSAFIRPSVNLCEALQRSPALGICLHQLAGAAPCAGSRAGLARRVQRARAITSVGGRAAIVLLGSGRFSAGNPVAQARALTECESAAVRVYEFRRSRPDRFNRVT